MIRRAGRSRCEPWSQGDVAHERSLFRSAGCALANTNVSKVVHRKQREPDRTDHPHRNDHRVRRPDREQRAAGDRRGPGRKRVVHRERREPDRTDQSRRNDHRVRRPDPEQQADWDRRRPGREPVVHREQHEHGRASHPGGGRSPSSRLLSRAINPTGSRQVQTGTCGSPRATGTRSGRWGLVQRRRQCARRA